MENRIAARRAVSRDPIALIFRTRETKLCWLLDQGHPDNGIIDRVRLDREDELDLVYIGGKADATIHPGKDGFAYEHAQAAGQDQSEMRVWDE